MVNGRDFFQKLLNGSVVFLEQLFCNKETDLRIAFIFDKNEPHKQTKCWKQNCDNPLKILLKLNKKKS